MKINLDDLRPQEATLELSGKPGKLYVLKPISLGVKIWIGERFGQENIKGIFENRCFPELSEIAYYLIKDKSDFTTLDAFRDAILTQQDLVKMILALVKTVGISEPLMEKLSKEQEAEAEGNALSPNPLIGAESST